MTTGNLMARKPRDYKKEYAQRLKRERAKAKQEGRKFDRHKARGHTSKSKEKVERIARKIPDEYWASSDDVLDLGHEHGWDALAAALDVQQKASTLYAQGRSSQAHNVWAARDNRFPDWLYYYHGISGGFTPH